MENINGEIINYNESQKNINNDYQIFNTDNQPVNNFKRSQSLTTTSPLIFQNSKLYSYFHSNSKTNKPTFYPFNNDSDKEYETNNQYNYLETDVNHDEISLPLDSQNKQPFDSLFNDKLCNRIVNFIPNKSEKKTRNERGVYTLKNNIGLNNINKSATASEVNFKKITKIEKINNISDIKNNQKHFENVANLKDKTITHEKLRIMKEKNIKRINENCKNNYNENNDSNLNFKENINKKLTKNNMINQFTNRNIATQKMLKKINFFEKLQTITNERMKYFEQRYKKDYNFMDKEYFDNIFINESDIKNKLPLTTIFYYIFNPETKITKLNLNKSFFESIFLLRGDTNLSLNYKKSKLLNVPKFFNDLDYVIHLFNNFNENELNNFLNEIDSWKNTFKFELEFVHPLKQMNIAKNTIKMKDIAKVYFVSPTDLIVDYHSFASDFPMANKFISITQYRFHCDIIFNGFSGKFEFKTSAVIYNKLQTVKKVILENELKNFANKKNEEELKIHTWEPFKIVIQRQSLEDNVIWDKLFEKNIEKTIKNYSIQIPKDDIIDNDNDVNNNNVSKKNTIKNKNIQKKEVTSKINSEIKGREKLNEKIKTEGKNVDKKMEDIENENEEENKLLSYGAFIIFFLFIFKTVFSIEGGHISGETFLNVITIIVIGLMLIKIHIVEA